MSDVVLAIDAGGTKLLGGLVTGDGAVLGADEVATPRAPEGCDPGLRALAALAARLADTASAAGHRVVGIGVGFPEYVRDGAVYQRRGLRLGPPARRGARGRAARRTRDRGGRRPVRRGGRGARQVDAAGIEPVLRVVGHRPVVGAGPRRCAPSRPPRRGAGPRRVAGGGGGGPRVDGNLERYAAGLSLGRRYAVTGRCEVDGRTWSGAPSRRRSGRGRHRRLGRAGGCPRAGPGRAPAGPGRVVLGGGLGTSGTRPPRWSPSCSRACCTPGPAPRGGGAWPVRRRA